MSDLFAGTNPFNNVHYTDAFFKGIEKHISKAYFSLMPTITLSTEGYFYNVFVLIKTGFSIFLYIVNSFQFIIFGDSSELILTVIVLMTLQIFSGMNKYLQNVTRHLVPVSVLVVQSAKSRGEQEYANIDAHIVQEVSK